MAYNTDISFHDVARVEIDVSRSGKNFGKWAWLNITLRDANGNALADLNVYSKTGDTLAIVSNGVEREIEGLP